MIVLIVFSLSVLFPTYWMVIGSLQPMDGLVKIPPNMIPKSPRLENYTKLFTRNPLIAWIRNTTIITTIGTILSVATAAMAGYAFSALAFRGSRILWWIFLACLALPRMSIIIPQFVTFRILKISHGFMGVIVPVICYPAGVLLFRLHADALPGGIYDAAKIDGASVWQTFTNIVLPLCTPVLGVLTIGKACDILGDYLWQSLILTQPKELTLVVGLVNVTQKRYEIADNTIGIMLSAGVLMMIPMLAVFITFQRSFKISLLGGGVKE